MVKRLFFAATLFVLCFEGFVLAQQGDPFKRAQQLHNKGKLSHAAVLLTELLGQDPSSAKALYERGVVYQKMNLSERAVADLTSYLEIQKDPKAYYYRALAHLQVANSSQAKSDLDEVLRRQPNSVDARLYRGFANNLLRDYRAAIHDLDQAIAKRPKSFNARVYRGVAHYFSGNQEKSVADFNAALKIKPNNALVYNNRGMAYLALGKVNKGFLDLNRARSLAAKNKDGANIAHETVINRLSHYLSNNQFREASRYIKTVSASKRKSSQIEVLLAAGLLKQGKTNAAAKKLAGILRKYPKNVEALILRALVSFRRKKYDASKSDLLRVLEQSSEEAYAHRLLGDIYYIQGQLRNAVSSYSSYIQLGGAEEVVYRNRAQASYLVRNYEAALQDYNFLISKNDKVGEYFSGRGHVYHKRGLHKASINDYGRAIKLGGKSAVVYTRMANALANTGRHKQAEIIASKGLKLHRNNAQLYRIRGSVRIQEKNTKGAIRDYRKSVKIKPNFDIYYRLGLLYNELNDAEQAIIFLTKALKLKSSHSLSYRHRGSLHEKIGHKDKAVADWKKGCKLGDSAACDFLRQSS